MSEEVITRVVNGYDIDCRNQWASIALPAGARILSAQHKLCLDNRSSSLKVFVEIDPDQKLSQVFDFIMIETARQYEYEDGVVFLSTIPVPTTADEDYKIHKLFHVFYRRKDRIRDDIPIGRHVANFKHKF